MTRDGLDTIARDIVNLIQARGILAEYDDSGAIGRRYRRQDEIGTPFAVTVDYESKENNTVTLRSRDTMKQVRIAISDLPQITEALIKGTIPFASLIP